MFKFKLFTILIIASAFLLATGVSNAQGKNTIKLKKEVFKPGESIQVTFTAQPGLKKNAWIGIIPSNVKHGSESENDQYDVAYKYLDGKTKGKLKFTAPAKKGKYDFRMNDTDDNGNEICSVSFTVE